MRAILTLLMLMIASEAWAECGKLCDYDWWKTATEADVQAELAAGAGVMARDKYGFTPLHRAAQFATPANVQTLLDAGADVMARDKYGFTPLHRAAHCLPCWAGVIQVLFIAGADAKAKNKNGKTPWDLAQENEKLKGTKGYWALDDAQYN